MPKQTSALPRNKYLVQFSVGVDRGFHRSYSVGELIMVDSDQEAIKIARHMLERRKLVQQPDMGFRLLKLVCEEERYGTN